MHTSPAPPPPDEIDGESKERERLALEILEEMIGPDPHIALRQPAAQEEGAGGEAPSSSAKPAEQQADKQQGKRPAAQPDEPPEDATRPAKRRLTRMPMTKDLIDGLRVFAEKKELTIIANGSYKMGCRMIKDPSRRKLAEEMVLSTIKAAKQWAADFIKEYDAKGYVEEPDGEHWLERFVR